MFRRMLIFLICITLSPLGYAKAPEKKRKPAQAGSKLAAPPQFVLLAFDGSKDNSFWDESMNFADTVSTDNGKSKLRFTYFINPTYYLSREEKKAYIAPGLDKPYSCIGYSNAPSDIPGRIARTNAAFKKGHEIASHANAHCDQRGSDSADPMYKHEWGFKEWDYEFKQFNTLLFDAFKINKLKPVASSKFPNGFDFGVKNIKGFRAPKLAYTSGMWPALQANGFTYDTSLEGQSPNLWPRKKASLAVRKYADVKGEFKGWNFPLGDIKVSGAPAKKDGKPRTTFSMDYNWLTYQTGGSSKKGLDDAGYQRLYTQVYESYISYFKLNYLGNRAPVNIGHHFSKWNKGVYWQVMQDFAKKVCNIKDVKCVTYSEYVSWLDAQPRENLEQYEKGNFDKSQIDSKVKSFKEAATPIVADISLNMAGNNFEAVIPEKDKAKVASLGWRPEILLNMQNQNTEVVTRGELLQKIKSGDSFTIRAALLNKSGAEVNWETFKVKAFNTENESIVGPLEDLATQGETAEAHDDEHEH